jgi:integrase
MNDYKVINFNSCLSELILGFIAEKRSVGYKFTKGASLLKQLDQFLAIEQQLAEIKLSKETVLLWTKKRANEKENTRSKRISIIRNLAEYMIRLGYEAYIYPTSAVKIGRYDYTPYIFSEEEIRKIFAVCDCYPTSNVSPNRHLIIPLLFRMLYGCGLRISEALKLKIEDVNLDRGTLIIRQTKFDKERIIPMAKSLTERCRKYMEKVHSFDKGSIFLFPSPYGGHYCVDTVYEWFRDILWKAGISHSGEGPRLHDVRHTFSVHCLKRWVLKGEDLTNLLPYLSVYLGHVDLRGTQRYLRLTADLYPSIIESVEKNYSDLIPEVTRYETD